MKNSFSTRPRILKNPLRASGTSQPLSSQSHLPLATEREVPSLEAVMDKRVWNILVSRRARAHSYCAAQMPRTGAGQGKLGAVCCPETPAATTQPPFCSRRMTLRDATISPKFHPRLIIAKTERWGRGALGSCSERHSEIETDFTPTSRSRALQSFCLLSFQNAVDAVLLLV